MTPRVLVIVPTYNEVESFESVAGRLFGAAPDDLDMLVIDDASPDGTAALVKRIQGTNERIHLIERSGKQGLGTAYVTGFGWAGERGYDVVVEMDADASHDPADVPRLVAALERADLAIGSRYVTGGRIENWSAVRRALSLAGNLYARVWLGWRVRDWTAGFRAYRTHLLDQIDLATVRSEGYAFQIEMTRRSMLAGARIVEVPITFVERESGTSKMSRAIVREALISVTRWGWRRLFRRERYSPGDA